jgi:hypothetical protein
MVPGWRGVTCKPYTNVLSACCTYKRRAPQFLEGFGFGRTLFEELPIDGTLRLAVPVFGVDQLSALHHAAIGRTADVRAIAVGQRAHPRWLGLGQGGLRSGQGRGNTGDPLAPGVGPRWEILFTVVVMPRGGTLRDENGRWRPVRESLVEWLPIGWLRGRVFVWCHEPVL